MRLLRRGYNFVDGTTELGALAAGLLFVCYQRDPRRQSVPIQRSLGTDHLNDYIVHVGSGLSRVRRASVATASGANRCSLESVSFRPLADSLEHQPLLTSNEAFV